MTDADASAHGRRRIAVITIVLIALAIVALVLWLGPFRRTVVIYTTLTDTKNLVVCKRNLSSLGHAIELYYQRFGSYPSTRSGVQFLLAPLKAGVVEYRPETIDKIVRNLYVCPADDVASGAIASNVWEAFRDLENLQPECVSYAGRNTIDFPLDRRKAAIEVIACDAGGVDGRLLTHRRTINVLFLDRSVGEIDISELPGGDESTFAVGPRSPIDSLRTLNKDP
ncbi:MAG: hypothetical protein JXQ29_14485 [Planctomycetes bacterium]|nr:hypothetical protein [Planctomycetota bacterium]